MIDKIAGFPLQDTAVGYYRITNPLTAIKRSGLIKSVMTMPFSGENQIRSDFYQDKVWLEVANGADILWTTLPWKEEELLKILNLRKWTGAKWIVDIDDNLYAVPVDNPASAKVTEQRSLWELAFKLADGVTTSVPMLSELFSPLNKNTYVQKNCLDLDLWDNLPDMGRTKHRVRIGWEGAYGHRDDLTLVYPALEHIVKDFEVELVAFGHKPERLFSEWHDWVGFQDYPKRLKSLGIDIMLAPLLDSAYNRCKSNLRLLDASAIKIPVVYSPTVNYRGFPGMPAQGNHEWYDALSTLVQDKQLRNRIGKGQYDFLRKNYQAKDTVKNLLAWMDALPRKDL